MLKKPLPATLLMALLATQIGPAHAFLDNVLQAGQQLLNNAASNSNPPAPGTPTKAPAPGQAAPANLPAALMGAATGNAAASMMGNPCQPRPGVPCRNALVQTRATVQLDKLLTGQPVTGSELMTELRSLRSSLATHNLNNAMQAIMGMANAPLTAAPSGNFFSNLFGAASDALLDMLTSEMSYQALDYFFGQMSEQPDLLKDITVTLPKAEANWSPEMKQQIVNMGTFLVAIKGSGKIIDASEKDFTAATDSYRKVLEARASAAKLLGEAFYAREGLFASDKEGQARGQSYLTEADRAYLETLRDKKPEEFLRDFQAQNIALTYLKGLNPKEYGDYRLSVGEFKTHYGAYAKTSVGAASMLGFSAMFIKRAKNLVEKNGLAAAGPMLALAGDGLTEITTLAPRVYKTLNESPDHQDGTFSLRLANGEIKRGLSADKVFSNLDEATLGQFRERLFLNTQAGYFGQLGEKYPQMAGQMLDHLVEKESRQAFIKGYLEESDLPDFSFQNTLTVTGKKQRELKSALFRSAPPLSSAQADEQAIARVQKDVRDKLNKWDNSALRRVMFANRRAGQPDGQMALEGTLVSIDSPGMRGIMDYEEMAVLGADHAVLRTAPATENKPAATDAKRPVSGKKKK